MKNLKCTLFVLAALTSTLTIAQTWQLVPSGTTKNLNSISFPSPSVGYIGGDDSTLLKTTDGGQTWNAMDLSTFPFVANQYDIVEVKFVSDLVGYIMSGPYTGTYKTIDGGLTWTVIDNIYACYNTGLYFFDENSGFLGGSGCFSGEIINKLSNGVWAETNITPQFIQSDGQINNFDFSTTNMGLATSTGNYFFRTTDGGSTWDTIPNTLNDTDSLTSVLFVNNSTVLATYTSITSGTFGVLVSFDTGLTWQPETNSGTFFYPNMYATEKAGNGRIYIGGEQSLTTGGSNPGLIYESDGSITNWSYELVAESIKDMDSYGDSVLFAVGENGYIVVNQDPATLGNLELFHFGDFTIYPNPNDGTFIIESSESKIDYIEILDLNGRVVFENTGFGIEDKLEIVTELKSGVYWLITEMKGQSFYLKFIIN